MLSKMRPSVGSMNAHTKWSNPMSESQIAVFENGAIYTGVSATPFVEAIAFCGSRVLAAGALREVLSAAGAGPRRVDLHGRMLMPGIIDMHNHVLEGALAELFQLTLSPRQSLAELLSSVREAAKAAEPGTWIVGAGWGPRVASAFGSMDGLQALDGASPRNPVLLKDVSYHSRIANSAAIASAGPETVAASRPGEVVLDPDTGRPTGLFHEAAAAILDEAAPPWHDEQLSAAARHSVRMLNRCGVTGFNLAVASRRTISAFADLERSGDLSVRMAAYIDHGSPLTCPRDGIGAELIETRADLRSERIRVDFAKFFMDGVPSLGTASVLTPYRDGSRGERSHYTVDELANLIAPLDGQGISVKVHAVGDRAIREVLDAIAVVRDRNGAGPLHQIAHATLIRPSDIPRLPALNVLADLCPPMWFPSPTTLRLEETLGEKYVALSHPIRDIIASGTLAAAGTDWPCVVPTVSPWPGLASLITRKNPYEPTPGQHRPEQALTLEQTLPLFTINPAIAMGIEKETGSLEPGKSADFIILDRDLSNIAPERIADTEVLATFFEGTCVHGGI